MRRPDPTTRFLPLALTLALLAAACDRESPTAPEVSSVRLAKPGSQDPEVTGTDPTSAPQDTTLDVEVSGSGFDDGSTVELTLAGVPSGKVRTNSTTYINPRKLIANITIDPDADVDYYDVEVTTSSKKKGIGAELFQVREKGQGTEQVEPLDVTARDDAADNLTSDNGGAYSDGQEGMSTYIAEPSKGGYYTLDAVESSRTLCLDFTDPEGTPDQDPPFDSACVQARIGSKFLLDANDDTIPGGMRQMSIGASGASFRQLQVWWTDGTDFDFFLRFGHDCNEDPILPQNRVSVTHPDFSTWTLEGTRARLCRKNRNKKGGKPGSLEFVGDFFIPFKFTATRQP